MICDIFAPDIITLFREEESVLAAGTGAFRWMCRTLFVLPVSAVGSMLFQSIGKKGRALFIALLQSGMVSVPLMLVLPNYFGIAGIWAAQPVAYLAAGGVTLFVMLSFFQEMKQETEEKHPE